MKVEVLGLTIAVEKFHFWLELADGVSAPLATHYDQNDRLAYCYLITPDGECRVYEDGEVFDAR